MLSVLCFIGRESILIVLQVYNASNNELVRTNTLVKGAIIQVDATPFRQWYEAHVCFRSRMACGRRTRYTDRTNSTPNQCPKSPPRHWRRHRRPRVPLSPPKSQTTFSESSSSERRMPSLTLCWRVSSVLVVCMPPFPADQGRVAGVTGTSWKARNWRYVAPRCCPRNQCVDPGPVLR